MNDRHRNIDLEWAVKIPMRDGVLLNATCYRPKHKYPPPVIFILTPYIADTLHERGIYFASHDYTFAAIDCRGRGNSEGDFVPNVNEGLDGHYIVDWISAQPWCNGSVTMWGGSYAGLNQWMTLKEFPEGLKTIEPVAGAKPSVDFPQEGNVFHCEEMQWQTLVSGKTPNRTLDEDAPQQAKPDSYIYDPLDTSPGELEMAGGENWITDQRFAQVFSDAALIYHSSPFPENTEITGNIKLTTWVELDVPDTDFQITLYEILKSGSSIKLTEAFLRARYRKSLREEKLIEAGVINKYVFDHSPFFSREMAIGSRLRLIIRAPNSIFHEKNYNSAVLFQTNPAKMHGQHI